MSYPAYAVLALATAAAMAVFLIPDTFSTTREVTFEAQIEEVWTIYTEPGKQPDWRSDIDSVSVSEDGESWTETLKRGGMTIHFEILERTRPERLVLRIGSPGNFKGRYVADFRKAGDQTVGTFTEEVTALGIIPKLMRFLFFDQSAFIERYTEEAQTEIMRRRKNQLR